MTETTITLSGASNTVAGYLKDGRFAIDGLFGVGYSTAHPELLSAFIAACVGQDTADGVAELANPIRAVAAAISGRK
jgi:hypothetical protein